ncbi:MAG: hypothetical protein BM556_14725 [Bacteriovorax sp. MedPE-SWde]|nr:MAG: hypothetical protein BM556_14725 [Bacteriovorax sp. MedPE-SWde]
MFNMIKGGLVLSAIALSMNAAAAFQTLGVGSNKIVNVRVNDVAKWTNNKVDPNLSKFVSWASKNNSKLFPDLKVKKVYNLFFTDLPQRDGDQFKYKLAAFVRTEGSFEELQFVKLNIHGELKWDKKKVKGYVNSIISEQIGLSKTNFKVEVSLADRKAIVKDTTNGLKMVFPLGVGAFDEGVLNDGVSILTPRFKAGFIDKKFAQYERKKPRYFMGKPFIRLHAGDRSKEDYTSIGFHTQPNGGEFIRAFDSHGCIRMQNPDLYAMYWIITQAPRRKTPLVVKFKLNDSAEHPFPLKNKPYKRVLNVGSATSPNWTMDRDDLVQTSYNWNDTAPISHLVDDAADDYFGIYDYKMAWRVKERNAAKTKKCVDANKIDEAKYKVAKAPFFTWGMSDRDKKKAEKAYKKAVKKAQRARKKALKSAEKSLKSCLKKAFPKRSFKDNLYRWWVHGKNNQ